MNEAVVGGPTSFNIKGSRWSRASHCYTQGYSLVLATLINICLIWHRKF